MNALSEYREISLNHSQFENNFVIESQCDRLIGNHTIVMPLAITKLEAIRKENNCYTSQLAIVNGLFLNGGSIQCCVGFGFGEFLIGTVALIISYFSKCKKPEMRCAHDKCFSR